MKKIALFVLWFMFCAVPVRGFILIPGPPAEFLPVGSQSNMLDWVVSNRNVDVGWFLGYKDPQNHSIQIGIGIGKIRFKNYADFQACMVTNMMRYLDQVRAQTNVASNIRFYINIAYFDDIPGGYNSMNIDTDLGPLGGVTRQSFLDAKPRLLVPNMIAGILQDYSILVRTQNGGVYTNYFNPVLGKFLYPTDQPELSKANYLVFSNPIYLYGTNWARFKLTQTGRTRTYTHFGEKLDGAYLEIEKSPVRIIMHVPRGGDVTLQSSGDSIHWNECVTFTNASSNTLYWTPPILKDHKIFRMLVK